MEKYIKLEDPRHGWLRVEALELVALGIAEKISTFSYMFGKYVYLEEDCDMAVFCEAKGWTNEDYQNQVDYNYNESNERIRDFPHYSLERIQAFINS